MENKSDPASPFPPSSSSKTAPFEIKQTSYCLTKQVSCFELKGALFMNLAI